MELLAKSPNGQKVTTLLAHSIAVLQAWVEFSNSRLGTSWKRFWGFSNKEWGTYDLNMRVSCLLHDIGKANESFQSAVITKITQAFRHEHLSINIIFELRHWIEQNQNLDLRAILAAIGNHHLKLESGGYQGAKHTWGSPNPDGKFNARLLLEHPEVRSILTRVGEIAGLGRPPELTLSSWSTRDPRCNSILIEARKLASIERLDPTHNRLLMALKSGLMIADAIGSGLVRNEFSIEDWIQDNANLSIDPDEILTTVVAKRVETISGFTGFNGMQEAVRAAPDRTLLIASCSSGKTIAAHLWLNSKVSTRGRAIYTYPTCATATEGFLDYISGFDKSALLHSKSKHALQGLLSNPLDGKGSPKKDLRLFALERWSSTMFSATCDQFFGAFNYNYNSTCLMPLLADSAIVIDELHAWDNPMFETLLKFLEFFPTVPVLCMSATIRPQWAKQLESMGFSTIRYDEDSKALIKKYLINTSSLESNLDYAVELYRKGLKVLWVANTVAECQRIARDLLSRCLRVEVYHSRYKDPHKDIRHRSTIDSFKIGAPPVVAVTTQVCEMSLDLQECQALITELCPMASLVQRLGRALRYLTKYGVIAPVRIYTREGLAGSSPYHPYTKGDFELARKFLAQVEGFEVSQSNLQLAFESLDPTTLTSNPWASALSPSFYSEPASFRGISDLTVPCILEEDLEKVLELARSKKPLDSYTIPVLARDTLTTHPLLPKWFRVSPINQHEYSPELGYQRIAL